MATNPKEYQGASTSGVLVTGGTGSLGRRVVGHLRGPGYEVRALSRNARGAGVVRGDRATSAHLESAQVLVGKLLGGYRTNGRN
jgi:nucleoside-diphosphate-sugar epimerase